jgi:hypothetical protein
MRKLLVFLILITSLLVGGYFLINSQLNVKDRTVDSVTRDRFIVSDGIQWYQDPDKQFNLAIFRKPFTLTFVAEDAQTLKEQSFLAEYNLAINATYYRGSFVESEHSGLLQIKGERFWDIVPDKQLTHIVAYDEAEDTLEFIPTSDFTESRYVGEDYTLFQTGPLIIEENEIQTDLINNSLNGDSRSLRTVFGVTDNGDKFVLITRVNYTLTTLAEDILGFPIFAGKRITVINLDGGNSTAMYSKELDQFNYRESSRLPVVIGVN